MRIFVDSFLDARLLSTKAKKLFEDPQNTILLSSVSSWEIAHKYHLQKLPLPTSPQLFIPEAREQHSIDSLPLYESDSVTLDTLPLLHRDPCDRLLVCQAQSHDMTLMTPDELIQQYEVETVW